MNSFYASNRSPLPETPFVFLPLGCVKPEGWLKRQLRTQADGLSGHLPEFWESLGPDSGWLGGDGESWERGPYYLDGLVPLAFLLQDETLMARAHAWMDWMLNSQDEQGHFGPALLQDWWPFGVALKALTQYQEATGDRRVIPLMERFFASMKEQLPTRRMHTWAIARWADTVLSILWLYRLNADPELLGLAETVMNQGYNWTWHFQDFAHTQKQTRLFPMRTHVVNNAMGVKAPAVAWQITGWEEHYQGAWTALQMLDTYHGTAAGVFTGDEHYAGKAPVQGTELCSVVEFMFSLENLLQTLGDPAFADRLEMIAFNALPGTFDVDMWAHQYDQQVNQVLCTVAPRQWTNNGGESNIFGLEPNYGCCTANMHQGWPKFAASLWMAAPDDGLAAVAYAPCRVEAKVRGGVQAALDVETDYPFDETIRVRLFLPGETRFPLSFRIPGWADGAALSVNGEDVPCQPGTFARVERAWRDGDRVELHLPMRVRAERRWHGSVCLKRGPLVYSLKIGERWEKIGGQEPHADYAVYPTSPWNYGLLVDPESPQAEVVRRGVGPKVFGPDLAPVELLVKGRRLPEWTLENNSAGPLPQSPMRSTEPLEDLTLIPYGCAKLRITEFPLLPE